MWHILLFSSETEISEDQVLRLSDWAAVMCSCVGSVKASASVFPAGNGRVTCSVSWAESCSRRASVWRDCIYSCRSCHTATNRNPTIKKLFWRVTCSGLHPNTCTVHPRMKHSLSKSLVSAPQSPDLYPFLVKTLSESSQSGQERVHTADRLL